MTVSRRSGRATAGGRPHRGCRMNQPKMRGQTDEPRGEQGAVNRLARR